MVLLTARYTASPPAVDPKDKKTKELPFGLFTMSIRLSVFSSLENKLTSPKVSPDIYEYIGDVSTSLEEAFNM